MDANYNQWCSGEFSLVYVNLSMDANYNQWCSGEFSLVYVNLINASIAYYGQKYPIVIVGGRVPEKMVIYYGKNPCSNKGVCVLDRAVRIYNNVLFYC